MSTDFDEMARLARRAHEDAVAEQKRASDNAKDRRQQAITESVALLESYVVPALLSAQTSFKTQSIDSEITRNYDVLSYSDSVMPKLKFNLLGPKRKSDGFQFKGAPVFFSTKDDDILWGIGSDSYEKDPLGGWSRTRPHSAAESVSSALERLLEKYFREIRENPHLTN